MAKNKIIIWLKKHRFEFAVLTLIILVSLCSRLYRISEYLTFLGDEGRDVRIVRDLLRGNLVFIGPQTSIGNMYLGPLYYYLIAPSLWLAGLNPVGPAVMNALIGTSTVFLTWLFARRLFNPTAALIAAFLFALSPVAIIYSRSSWNPNPMPLFALLSIWGIYQVWQFKKDKYLFLVAVSLAFALQMHYLGLLLLPTLGVFWLISFLKSRDEPERKNKFIKLSLLSLFTLCLLMSPLLLFDLKHDLMNFNAFKQFFSNRQTTININPTNSDRFLPVIFQIIEDLLLSRQQILLPFISFFVSIFSVFAYFSLDSKGKTSAKILFLWLIFAVIGLGIYKQHVYAHYFGFIYPAIYLLAGLIISSLFLSKHLLNRISAGLILAGLTFLSIKYSPLQESPHRQLQRTETIVSSIIKESNQKPFNFGLIAKQNYDESYRYFFENQHANLIRGEEAITDQLFVVCEDGDLCQPLGNPAWQIAVFGQAKIEKEWQVDGIKLYQLVHPD